MWYIKTIEGGDKRWKDYADEIDIYPVQVSLSVAKRNPKSRNIIHKFFKNHGI